MITVFDVETSRFPDGNPYRLTSRCISWCADSTFSYHTDPDFRTLLQKVINDATLLVGINLKFDIAWASRLGCTPPERMRVWDCQIAEYILSGQTNSFASMEQLCELYQIPGKGNVVQSYWDSGIETRDIPRNILEEYNRGDITRTRAIYEAQQRDSRMTPQLHKLILLDGADLLVLQKMEENGILYDRPGSIAAGNSAQEEIEQIKQTLQGVIDFEHFNLDSGDHLSCLLYGGVINHDRYETTSLVYKSGPKKGEAYTANRFQETIGREYPGLFKPLKRTELKKKGYYQTGEPILRQLPCRSKQQRLVINSLLRLAELSKQVGSFLHALPELCDTMEWGSTLHPTYNQCVARTGRLSCSKPNAQQFPEVVDKFWVSRYAS